MNIKYLEGGEDDTFEGSLQESSWTDKNSTQNRTHGHLHDYRYDKQAHSLSRHI